MIAPNAPKIESTIKDTKKYNPTMQLHNPKSNSLLDCEGGICRDSKIFFIYFG